MRRDCKRELLFDPRSQVSSQIGSIRYPAKLGIRNPVAPPSALLVAPVRSSIRVCVRLPLGVPFALCNVELYRIAFLQRGAALNGGRVHKHILAAVFRSYESEPLPSLKNFTVPFAMSLLYLFFFALRACP